MNDTIIKVRGVSKKFCRTLKHTMLYGTSDLARNFIGVSQNTEHLRNGEFWAVDDVSFELKRGECVGLIGPNGSGKSTLLKMLNGIFMPDRGMIEIQGRVGALIEVGAGFHPLLTGRENIYINGAILGMTKREIDEKLNSILDFAEIGEFIDAPVKHYSSGMYVKLGFSVAAHLTPDVLLIDEVLSVGDLSFQIKCMNHVQKLIHSGIAVVFVSHNLYQVQRVCNGVFTIEQGKISQKKDPLSAVLFYEEKYGQNSIELSEPANNFPLQFLSAKIEDTKDSPLTSDGYYILETYKPFRIVIQYTLTEPVDGGIQIGVTIKSAIGQLITGFTSMEQKEVLPGTSGDYKLLIEFPQNLLLNGNYFMGLSAFNEAYTVQLGAWEAAVKFRVNTPCFNGLHTVGTVTLAHTISCQKSVGNRSNGVS